MNQPKIGIVIGSTRQGRFGEKPAAWIHGIAAKRDDLQFEIVDLRDHPMPLFDEAVAPAWGPVQNEAAKAWNKRLAGFDGFIFITAEYNHGPTAALKNALDYGSVELVRKPVAFVGYGGMGATRAVEQLRTVIAELQMVSVRNAVHMGMAEFFPIWQQGRSFDDFPHLAQAAEALLDDLAWWAKALKNARAATVQDGGIKS